MSVEKQNMLFGVGELYINNVRIGNMKAANFIYTKEFAEAKPGDMVNIVRRDLKKETLVLTGTLCDIDISRIPMLMGLTMSTSQLTNTTTLRIVEEVTLPASITVASTAGRTLAEHAISETNPVLYTADYQTKLVKATDYTITNSTSTSKTKIWPKSASMRNKVVLVSYDYADKSALTVKVGGKTTHEEMAVKFVHVMSNGKRLQVTVPKMQVTGEFNLPFGEDDYSTLPVSFTAIGNPALAKGQRLFKITRER